MCVCQGWLPNRWPQAQYMRHSCNMHSMCVCQGWLPDRWPQAQYMHDSCNMHSMCFCQGWLPDRWPQAQYMHHSCSMHSIVTDVLMNPFALSLAPLPSSPGTPPPLQ